MFIIPSCPGLSTTNQEAGFLFSAQQEGSDLSVPVVTPQRYLQYLSAVRGEFHKLARLDFLQPDGSLAFSIDNNPQNPRSGAFIQEGELSVNLQNGMRRQASVTLSNLDGAYDYNVNKVWFGQQIRLMEGLVLPDGTDFYLPQGVFYVKDPEETFLPNQRLFPGNLGGTRETGPVRQLGGLGAH